MSWMLDRTLLGTRTSQRVTHELEAIGKLADEGELQDWLQARGQGVGDCSRAAMVRAARHWRGLGDEGDDAFIDKGVVLPAAQAWMQAKVDVERAEQKRKEAAAKASFEQLAPAAFVPTRCCAATFATEGALLRCARCKRSYYASREVQKAHWRTHSATCRAVDEAEARGIAEQSLPQVLRALSQSLRAGGDATTSLLMVRLLALFDAGADEDSNAEMEVHTLGRSLIFHGDDAFFSRLWAAPGMAPLLLLDEWLLTGVDRKKKHWFPRGMPIEESLPDLQGSARDAAETLLALDDDDGWATTSGAYKFCYLYFNVIVGSALHGTPSMSSVHDGRGRLRTGPFAAPALQRALDLWACPYVRRCCGDAMAAAASLASTAVSTLLTSGSPAGVQLDGAGVIVAALDETESGAAGAHAAGLLGRIQEDAAGAFWAGCDVAGRARAAVALAAHALEHRIFSEEDGDGGGGGGYGSEQHLVGGRVLAGLLEQLLRQADGSLYADKPRGWLRAQVLYPLQRAAPNSRSRSI
jgi:hypothetical protein